MYRTLEPGIVRTQTTGNQAFDINVYCTYIYGSRNEYNTDSQHARLFVRV